MTRPIRLLASFLTLACIGLAIPQGASAQSSDDDQAHAHFQVAASYYEQANYESALREFLEAYRLSQRSQLFYNLSLCYQQLGDLDHAVDYLTRYLHDVSDIANRASLETRLENLRARQAAHAAGTTPPPDPELTTTTSTTPTTTTPAVTAPAVTAPPVTPGPSSGGDSLNVGAIASFSVAGVALITGLIFGGLTIGANNDAGMLPCASTRTCADSQLSTLRTDALVGDIMFGVSLAAAAVAVVLLIVNPGGGGSSGEHASLRVGPTGLSVEGAF